MRANEILKHTKKEPFRPFRVFVSEGATYDIRHPEMILVTQTEIAVAINRNGGEVPFEMAYCDPIHVTRIEYIAKNGSSASRKSKR
ncbi:MAG: hypothetical protein AABZ08_08360 [Planctomycetota bacterium]